MSENTSLLKQRAICVITGGSRGIGREIAIQLSSSVPKDSLIILTARDAEKLNETSNLLSKDVRSHLIPNLDLETFSRDNELRLHFMKQLLEAKIAAEGEFEQLILVHNAGTLGDNGKKATELTDPEEIRGYCDVNITSMMLLNNLVLTTFKNIPNRSVINITSLMGIKGFPTYGLYATGKHAREGFMKVLAAENPDIRVLNYSPGPVETDMLAQVKANAWDPAVREMIRGGNVLKPQETVKKLLEILDRNSFESGGHVDYFDP